MRNMLARLATLFAVGMLALILMVGTAQAATPSPSLLLADGHHHHHHDMNTNQKAVTPPVQPVVTPPPMVTPPARQAPQAQAPNPNCTLVVPPGPLTAAGLATPYQLAATDKAKGPCKEANANQSAFVEAMILDPTTGQLSIYRPLVVDKGTQPAILPTPPTLPADAVVAVWFGFQGTTLTLANPQGCVNGAFMSPFGQVAYCNAPEFFAAVHAAMKAGLLQVPPLAMARDGEPCPTTRDYSIVDQDQSDNLDTRYVVFPNGLLAQDMGNDGAVPNGSMFLNNGSDNGLLNSFIQPALGCSPLMAPDLTAGGRLSPSLALNELQAENQPAPAALVPENDPMVLFNGVKSIQKTNLYRVGVDQPLGTFDTSFGYCRELFEVGLPRLRLDFQFTSNQPTPDAAQAPDLASFLLVRFRNTLMNLGCPRGIPPRAGN